ncbi:MAG: deoxyribose-phosphate aldolase [Gammaproteobacteria bacterium]|nr:deoxyribose-phosphate aldolase [Gammaproteobacteria bacterium]
MASDDALARKILPLIDLTSLNSADTDREIIVLCKKAQTLVPPVAAVCLFPHFVSLASQLLINSPIKIATVANFPAGNEPVQTVFDVITKSIEEGAHEIDVVFPYERYLQGEVQEAKDFILHCKKLCGSEILLKVILETGVLQSPDVIANVSELVILAGADFIKTSTGKVPVGATLEAAAVMLSVIKKLTPQLHRNIGFKASGGIPTIEQAVSYLELAAQMMGESWITPKTFRFGTSQLVDELLNGKISWP